MKISTLINKLNELQKEHGDILLFDQDMYAIIGIEVLKKDIEDPPSEYKMPNKWVSINTTR